MYSRSLCTAVSCRVRSLSSRFSGRHTSPEKPGKVPFGVLSTRLKLDISPRNVIGWHAPPVTIAYYSLSSPSKRGRSPALPLATARGHGVGGRRRPSTARTRRRESLTNWQGSKVPSSRKHATSTYIRKTRQRARPPYGRQCYLTDGTRVARGDQPGSGRGRAEGVPPHSGREATAAPNSPLENHLPEVMGTRASPDTLGPA